MATVSDIKKLNSRPQDNIFSVTAQITLLEAVEVPISGNYWAYITLSDDTGSLKLRINDRECFKYEASLVLNATHTFSIDVDYVPSEESMEYRLREIS